MKNSTPMTVPVTGVVLICNGEKYLAQTLASMSFCDQLLLVDSGSTEQTLDIAHKAGAVVLHRPWEGVVSQWRFALEQVKTPWILALDQDEILSATLSEQVKQALHDPGENHGFYVSRRSWYMDRFIRHGGWYPDRLLRLFRVDSVRVGGMVPHQEFFPVGKTGVLTGDIIHYPYADMAEHLSKINYYSQAAAQQLYNKGRRAGLATALGHAAGKFFKQYILRAGFLDGQAGFVLAIHSFFATSQKYLRLAELCQKKTREHTRNKQHAVFMKKHARTQDSTSNNSQQKGHS